jgi:hypothetical protein
MAIKFSIAAILMLCSVVMMVWSNHQSGFQLTVKGNDELGLQLELPYLKESPADVIIINNSDHDFLAYKIRWESIKHNGEVVERAVIGCHSLALLEKNPAKRRALLAETPLLPPHTKWFVGLGREHYQITGKVLSLEELGRDPELFPDIKEYKQINVTLDGAILEDGRVVGRDPAAFGKQIDELVAEYAKDLKEWNDANPFK